MHIVLVILASVVALAVVAIVVTLVASSSFRSRSREIAAAMWSNGTALRKPDAARSEHESPHQDERDAARPKRDAEQAERGGALSEPDVAQPVRPDAPIAAEQLDRLPAPVRRWLERAGVVGHVRVRRVRLTQTGRIRQDLESGWMPIEAEQYIDATAPGFVWSARVPVAGIPFVSVRDALVDGAGSTEVKAMGLIAMDEQRGAEMDIGALQRYLGEIAWLPTAALGAQIAWESIDDRSARATIRSARAEADAVFTFDERDDLVRFTTDRYRTIATGFTRTPQSFLLDAHASPSGLRIPMRARAAWHLPEGDVETIELKIESIEYDRATSPQP